MIILMTLMLLCGISILIFEDVEPIEKIENRTSFIWMLCGVVLAAIPAMWFIWHLVEKIA